MKTGRPAKANTIYKVSIHNNVGRKYASTQPYIVDENGKEHYSHKHWGIDADRLKLNVYFDIHKRADDLARVQMAITIQAEIVQAVYETGKPVSKEGRETFRKENNSMKIAFWKSGK